jgi:hypothetical protein
MIPSGVHRVLRCSSLCLLIAAACREATSSEPCDLPEILSTNVTFNPANVLSVFISARVRGADSVAVRYHVATSSHDDITPRVTTSVAIDSVLLPVLGLQPSTHYTMSTVAYTDCGSIEGPAQQLITDSLPAGLPRYFAGGENPSPGYVVFSAGSYGLAIDNSGRVAWYYRFPGSAGLNFQPQPNGRYLSRPSVQAATPGSDLLEIDPLGNITRRLGCLHGLQARLHDFIAMSDESYWVMCDETRTVDLTSTGGPPAAQVLGVRVQHVGRDGAALFEWSAFDHLQVDFSAIDPQDRIAGAYNWTHANAIDVDSTGYLYVSFRNLNEIVKIDTRDGGVVWRMGGRANQFTLLDGADPAFVRQHGLRVAGPNRLILLDNLGNPRASRGELYEMDEQHHTARMIKTFASGDGVVAQIGGTTQTLPGGRILLSFGNGGRVEEFDSTGASVWRISGNPGYIFRAQRISSLYSPGIGVGR